VLSFPPFRLDLDSERLWKNGEELKLRRKPFAILRHLVQHRDRLVTHAEIVEAVWGKIAMSESLLRTHVRDLRQGLGEGVIETVVGRGYRFLPEVAHVDGRLGPNQRAEAPETFAKPVVGRESELETLRGALRSARDRRRTTVFVTGEGGVGKTTLVDYFLQQASAQGALLVGRGACIEQYGSGQVFLPVLDAIGALCRGRSGDRVLDVFARHAPTWLVQMPNLVRPDRFEDLQRRAIGATPTRTLRELVEALETLSSDAAVVLVLDDLHWTDPSTAELLAILASRREPACLLVLGTYRPAEVTRTDPVARVAGQLIAHQRAQEIALEGFTTEALDGYLTQRFGGHRFPPELARTLAQTTGGLPLFVTTFVDDLEAQGLIVARDGGWDLTIPVDQVAARRPDGVRRLINTQIDRLGAPEQRVIEAAAVAGTTFTAGAVAHALDADVDSVDSACESLATGRKLLQYVGAETWPDGTIQSRYVFGHSLFQHAAVSRSTSATVRAWHRKIGERLEAGYPHRAEEVSAELAKHFDRGQVPANAARHYFAAGERAARRYGLHEAIAHYERARALLDGLPGGRERDVLAMRTALRLGWRLFQRDGSPNAAIPMMEKAGALAARLDEKASLAETQVRLGFLFRVRGDMRKASEHARAAATLLEHVEDGVFRVFARASEAATVLLCGDLQEASRLFAALGIPGAATEAGVPEPWCDTSMVVTTGSISPGAVEAGGPPRGLGESGVSLFAMAQGAFALWLTGKPDDAIALARKGYEAADAHDEPWDRAAFLAELATIHAWRREPAQAEAFAKRCLTLAKPGAFGLWANLAELVLRWTEAELAPDVSEARADELLSEPWDSIAFGSTMPSVLYVSLCVRLGRADRAIDVISETFARIERTGERWLEPELHRLRGEILRSTDAPEAGRCFVTAIAIAHDRSSPSLELRALLSLHALVSGAKKQQARNDLARVLSLITGGQDTPDVVDARRVVEPRQASRRSTR